MSYKYAEKKSIWRTERKFCDEFRPTIEHLGLDYKIDKMTKFGNDSFLIAIIQQLRRKDVYNLIGEENQIFVDRLACWILREKVCQFITSSDHPNIKAFREKFEKEGPKTTTWDKHWEDKKNEKCLPNVWFIEATAWFLNIDIMVVTLADEKDLELIWEVSGNLDNPEEKAQPFGPLVIGSKCDLYYLSLLLEENGEKLEKGCNEKSLDNLWKIHKKTLDEKKETKCPNCGLKYQRLLKHLSFPSTCYDKVDENFIVELKSKAKANHKASKAKSRKKIQTHETFKAREDRLAMQSYYMMKKRMKRQEAKNKNEEEKK